MIRNFRDLTVYGDAAYATVDDGWLFPVTRGVFKDGYSWRFLDDGEWCSSAVRNLEAAYLARAALGKAPALAKKK